MIALLLAALAPTQTATAVSPPALPSDPLPGDWRPIPPEDLMVMTLVGGRTVVVRLAARYAPEHVANVRRLALAHYWDGTSIYRVQDNWVTQWGGRPADADDDPANKPLPSDVVKVPAAEYDVPGRVSPAQLVGSDAYARATGITADGWAIATEGPGDVSGWLTHCYGTVAVARDASPDTGSGSELFMPIGGSARRLDRNYTIIGRVVEGARFLSGLPRSDTRMGVYATNTERTPIMSVRLATEMPAADRPRFEYRAADNVRFAAALTARRHPPGIVSSGGLDVCDVFLATRRVPSG